MSDEEQWKTSKMVYTGESLPAKGTKRVGVWLVIGEDDLGAEQPVERVYSRRIKGSALSHARPGQVFSVEADEKGSIRPSTAKYVGMWHDEAQTATWYVLDASRRAAMDASDRQRKDANVDRMLEALEPLRRAYREAPAPHRPVLLAMIVERITRR